MTVDDTLLGPAEIRAVARRLGLVPSKSRGQNFLHDPNTIRRIVRLARVSRGDHVLEIGPGLGSLTLGLLSAGAQVTAVEIDARLAKVLPSVVAGHVPSRASKLTVHNLDALQLTAAALPQAPGALVANLPYNVAVPALLHALATFPSLERGLIMVQAEVGDRLAAEPGSKVYGGPSAKLAWYADSRRAGAVPRSVFWPVPNVDSGLVAFSRRSSPVMGAETPSRQEVFAVIDAAFAQRRKTLRSALTKWAGSAARAERILREAGVAPSSRGEQLGISTFAAIALAARDVS